MSKRRAKTMARNMLALAMAACGGGSGGDAVSVAPPPAPAPAPVPATLRNLTAEAGFGDTIAARDPSVRWGGSKAIVSLVLGTSTNARWQVYEVSGLGRSEKVVFKRLNQPDAFNHIGAVYDSRDCIVMVSDMPCPGPGAEQRHLYPQLDEYEEKPTPSGLWRLEPGSGAQGAVTLLHHAPSGEPAGGAGRTARPRPEPVAPARRCAHRHAKRPLTGEGFSPRGATLSHSSKTTPLPHAILRADVFRRRVT